jgi:hypothetical protein
MHASLISTPTDMRPFVGCHDSSLTYLVNLDSETEPAVRHAIDGIYQDFPYVGGDNDLVAAYLTGIEKELSTLPELGTALLALSTTGTARSAGGSDMAGWTRTHFIVAPAEGYFQLLDNDEASVYRFDAACDQAMHDLANAATSGKRMYTWNVLPGVSRTLGHEIPWCRTCCLAEALDMAPGAPAVQAPAEQNSPETVARAIADAEVLIHTTGPGSAVDRLHTALHGFLKAKCAAYNVEHGPRSSATELLSKLRDSGAMSVGATGSSEDVKKVLRSLGAIVDALSSTRNRRSMAHPNDELVTAAEAALLINAARTVMQYLRSVLADPDSET